MTVSLILKMKVLGALEYAEGETMVEQYKAVSQQLFTDEDSVPHQFTWRTIQTWWYHYRQHGATRPAARCDKHQLRKSTPEELLHAIEQVLPHFNNKRYNIAAIYKKGIELGFLEKDRIAENTFRRHVKRFELLKPESQVKSKRRQAFSKQHANEMWQCDTLVGPYLQIKGERVRTYLICFIDDASRIIPHGQFYLNDNTPNLIHCFQNGIFKRGVPRAMYVDNGSNYASKEMHVACCRIGIALLHTPIKDGAAKGKIERFFRTVRDQFLIRKIDETTTLQTLNNQFSDWVEDEYHSRKHSILDMRPRDRYNIDHDRIQWLQQSEYNKEIFYHQIQRTVKADNTFQHNKTRYEPPCYLAKSKIIVRYDRANTNQPPIVYQDDIRLGEATPLNLILNDRKPNLSNRP